MVNQCADIDKVLRDINKRMRRLEKSDSEKTEEIGRLNRLIGQKDVEIHRLQTKLDNANARIEELEGDGRDDDEEIGDDTPNGGSGKPELNSRNSSVSPSQESIAARELRRTSYLRKPSNKPSGGQLGHKGSTLQTTDTPDRIVKHEPQYCKCCDVHWKAYNTVRSARRRLST